MGSATCSTSSAPWATPRDPDWPTLGGWWSRTADLIGRPLMGWQAEGLDAAGEYDPSSGRMRYPVVVWIVPRRAGKTYAAGVVNLLGRSLIRPRVRCWYTLHRREVGAAAWRDDWYPTLDAGPLGRQLNLRRSNGSEAVTVNRLGSTVRLIAPDGQALRSADADALVVDEALRFSIDQGDTLEAAARPAMLRRPGRQLWVISSAGTIESTWLARYRDAGRAGSPALCYLEYAAPLDVDPYDPATWARWHPAVASGDVAVEALAADAGSMDHQAFTREYLGWWHDAPPDDPDGLAGELWGAALDPDAVPGDPRAFAVDVALDGSSASVAVAGVGADGRLVLELIAAHPGAAWVTPYVIELRRTYPGAPVALDTLACAAQLADLERRGTTGLVLIGAGDNARACAHLVQLARDGALAHRGQGDLDASLARAARRRLGEGWAWTRRAVDHDVTPIAAATLAAWCWRTRPVTGRPGFGVG